MSGLYLCFYVYCKNYSLKETHGNFSSAGEDLVIWITVEPLCRTSETNERLYVNEIKLII